MQSVSATYTTILSGKHRAEWKVKIDGTDYGESVLESIKISSARSAAIRRSARASLRRLKSRC